MTATSQRLADASRHPTACPPPAPRDPAGPPRRWGPLALAFVAAATMAGCGGTAGAGSTARPGAAVAPSMGAALTFSVLAGQTVTNTGPTTVVGDLGVSPGTAVTGFPPGLVSGGAIHAADAAAAQAQADLTASYLDLAGRPCDSDASGSDLAGRTLTPGVYCFTSSALLSGALVLDAQGAPDAVFVFKIGSALTAASGSSVRMINGGQSCQVFWQVGSSATLGTGATFLGSILALTSIEVATGATVSGRLLARNGAVTLDTNSVALGACTGCAGTVCGGACVDTATDPANCGACGQACAAGDTCSAGACVTAPAPVCRDLGPAASFDVFTLGAFTGHDSAVQGAVAACGDFTATNYAIGGALAPGSLALVLSGDLRYRTGTVNGDVIYGGELCWLCDVAVAGTVTKGTLLDCAAAGAYLEDYSAALGLLPASGTTSLDAGIISLAGSDATLDVFSVPASMLLAAWRVDLRVPQGAHVLVNVTGGGTVAMTNLAWITNGLTVGELLLNFPGATQLSLQGTSVIGSILAPLAAVQFDDGVVTGQIVSGSFSGQGRVDWSPYDSCIGLP